MLVNITLNIAPRFDVPVTFVVNLGGNVGGSSTLTPQSPGLQASRTASVGTPLTRIPSTPGAGAVPVAPPTTHGAEAVPVTVPPTTLELENAA